MNHIDRKKKFVLLFDDLKSIHLFKDIGQIPFQLQKHFGYDTEIVCRRGEEHFLYLDDILSGLKIRCFDGSLYSYLVRNAHEIDILMLFHVSTRSIYRGLVYKFLNPDGCLYVKADMSGDTIRYARWGERNPLTQIKRSFLFSLFAKRVDIVSFETKLAFKGVASIAAEKKLLIPNGFDPEIATCYGIKPKPFHEKENILLVVGRHGEFAKNSELMFDVLPQMGELDNWQIWFVGSMSAEFQKRRDSFLAQYKNLVHSVVFTGQIDDKAELFELYNRSKILCLTSRWESWGLVCVEAMAFGCVPVMTEVSSAADITANGTAGIMVEQGQAGRMAQALASLMASPDRMEELSGCATAHFRNNFVWKECLTGLDRKINEVYGQTSLGSQLAAN